MLGNLGKKVIADLAIILARVNLLGLVSNLAPNEINALYVFWMKIQMILLKKKKKKRFKGITEIVNFEIKRRRQIFAWFVSTFGSFISTTSNFFVSKRYKWKMG